MPTSTFYTATTFTSIMNTISTPSPSCSPSPIVTPFEDPPWFGYSAAFGYLVVATISTATLVHFIYYVLSVEYKHFKSISKCFSKFNILLAMMFASVSTWSISNLFAVALYQSNVAPTYVYYNNMEVGFGAAGDFGSCLFRVSYLIFGWLRSCSLIQINRRLFNVIKWFILVIVPLVMFLPFMTDVTYMLIAHQMQNDPTFSTYMASYNTDTGVYNPALASSTVLQLSNEQVDLENVTDSFLAVVIIFCAVIDLFLVAVFAISVAKARKVANIKDFKIATITKYCLISLATMLLSTILQCIRSYDHDMSFDLNIWMNVMIIFVSYITALILYRMKIVIKEHYASPSEKGSKSNKNRTDNDPVTAELSTKK